jgi:beta-lactamase superfamily II metal-dependent hydrolase
MTMPTGFVGRRADGAKINLFEANKTTKVRDVRWGDFLDILDQTPDGWSKIKWGIEELFIRTEHVVPTRPVELVFLDVGQGDGCLFVSAETGTAERIMIIDAGEAENMFQFLNWRFGKFKEEFRFHAAIVTHSDQDHYKGFQAVFDHAKIKLDRVYHNGIAERTGPELLGPSDATKRLLTGIIVSDADMRALYSDPAVRGGKLYPKLMHTALTSGRVNKVEMLSTMHGTKKNGKTWVPQFAPGDGPSTTIEVLGPVPEGTVAEPRLRWFGDTIGSTARNEAKTKNGHSVILRLTVGHLNVLFGGDLNRPAEDHLLRHYGGIAATAPLATAVTAASARLGADVMKCCHHGAADVTDEFVNAVNPFAYVVSSGDEESHAHPRPDLLGRLGKLGRGAAPLILCTEILRSTREKGREEDFKQLADLDERIDTLPDGPDKIDAQKERKALQDHIRRRNVGVYGAITVRSDGAHMEISFRLEVPRGKQLWQVYALHHDSAQGWVLDDAGAH